MGAAEAAAAKVTPEEAVIKPDMRAAANRRLSLPRMCSSPEIGACNFLVTLPPPGTLFQCFPGYGRKTIPGTHRKHGDNSLLN
jgi:hypothetical protein